MSYYSDASLVLIPSGYKNQKVYSAKPTDGSGDLTFSRASNATRVGPDGLIEKVRTNQALYSEDFTNAYWLKTNSTITGNTIANPIDGALTADTYTPTNVSATNRIRSASISLASAGMSIYVKANGYTKVGIREDATSGYYASYDLSSGTILDSSGAISPTITSLSNGWYRISLGVIAPPASMGVWILDPTYTSGTFNAANWTADGTSGIYVFGAQIEGGDIATDYIATTSAAVSVGPVSGLPRLDYSGGASCPSLLLEPQRTNSATYSEQFDNAAWIKFGGATVTANTLTSPDGYTNADTLNIASGQEIYSNMGSKAASAIAYTFSCFAKYNSAAVFRITASDFTTSATTASFNLQTGVATFSQGATWSNTSVKMENYGNGWYRCIMTTTTPTTTGLYVSLLTQTSGSVYIYGMQTEAGTYATSYIPTLGAAVTRLADSASKTGISSLIGQTEGTMFVEVNLTSIKPGTFLSISEGTTANRVDFGVSAANLFFIVRISATESASTVQTVSGTVVVGRYKIAVGYKSGNTIFYINGVQSLPQITDTFTFVNALTKLSVGNARNDTAQMGDGVTQAALFPTRLTNAQLAELTTL